MIKQDKTSVTKEQMELFKSSPMELYLFIDKELADTFSKVLESRKRHFRISLETRVNKAEKIEITHQSITIVRNNIEGDIINNIYVLMNQNIEQMFEVIFANGLDSDYVFQSLIGGDLPTIKKVFATLMDNANSSPQSDEEIENSILKIRSDGMKSIALESAIRNKSADFERRLMYSLYFIHYEKVYLSYLLDQYRQLQEEIPISNIASSKIEWVGTQAELGELFIELKNKGYIIEHTASAISNCFTKSDSISQYLQPYTDTKSNTNLYSKVYTPRYKPKFSKIEKQLKATKSK